MSLEPEEASTLVALHHTYTILTTPEAFAAVRDLLSLSGTSITSTTRVTIIGASRYGGTGWIVIMLVTMPASHTQDGSSFGTVKGKTCDTCLATLALIAGTVRNGTPVVSRRKLILLQVGGSVLLFLPSEPLLLLLQTFSLFHGSGHRSTIEWFARR